MTHQDVLKKPSENKNHATLGFGCMRLPSSVKEVTQMTDAFLDAGFNYFDTAYLYTGSEEMLKKTLVTRHHRDSYMIATKIPPWIVNNHKDHDKVFKTSLKRLGTDYVDFLLVHALDCDTEPAAVNSDLYGWAAEQKKKGYVKHVGFSFHDTAYWLEKVLVDHPEMEFVLLQLNYMDILRGQGKSFYDLAIKYDKPLLVMEAMRGGALAKLPPAAEALMKNYNPDASIASWANRYAASLAGATTLLSGMSSLEQMHDNIKTFSPLVPINNEEMAIIETVVSEIGKVSTIPCTGCGYCLADCPEQIEIVSCFSYYNEVKRGTNQMNLKMQYDTIPDDRRANDCTSCGACVPRCPQHIDIPKELKKAAKMFA